MSPLDIILIIVIAAAFALALRRTIKKKGSCNCGSGACDGCSGCRQRNTCDHCKT
nr:hypothetical protein [Lachnospiraceae bacterium]